MPANQINGTKNVLKKLLQKRKMAFITKSSVIVSVIMSKAKQKGTAAETALVIYLRENGYENAERRALTGKADRGDIAGIPRVVIEVKAGNRLEIPAWLKETEIERINDGALAGYLVIKPKGIGAANVGQWWVIQTVEQVFGK